MITTTITVDVDELLSSWQNESVSEQSKILNALKDYRFIVDYFEEYFNVEGLKDTIADLEEDNSALRLVLENVEHIGEERADLIPEREAE